LEYLNNFLEGLGKMALERTLSIIKPDATERNLTGKINAMFEETGLRIVAQRRIRLSREQAESFYEVHNERSFFGELVDYMISAPVVAQVLEGKDAVATHRKIMGATNPAQADEGTVRKEFALNVQENSVHGSDSVENAAKEISFFFSDADIVG
jgi:nucleoside-diphosphate kinase